MKKTTHHQNNLSSLNGEVISQTNNIFNLFRYQGIVLFSIILLLMVLGISLAIGHYHVPFNNAFRIVFSNLFNLTNRNWDNMQEAVVMNLRLPRTIAAIIIGAALALSGATYQSIFKIQWFRRIF